MSELKKHCIINFENIYVNYGMTTILKNINLKINSDENWAVLGPNGSGKSTLIKLFSHDIYPNTEYNFKKEIFNKDRWNIFELRKKLGIVTNDLHNRFLYQGANATSIDVVLSGYEGSIGVFSHHKFSAEQYKEAEDVLKYLDLLEIKDKKVGHMSTGQLRRCVIGRSLIHSPQAFVLDEPTTGLDIKSKQSFLNLVQKLAKKIPIILITHDITEIFSEITHVALMYDGMIYKQGEKDDILTSENLSKVFGLELELKKENNRFFVIPK